MNAAYRLCTRCVMDTSAGDISFDAEGRCNYCVDFEQRYARLTAPSADERARTLARFVERVKRSGRGKPYDCVVGVSGGLDSSWTLVQAVRLGLRPLAAHMDNGWNSELAQSNIENLVKRLATDPIKPATPSRSEGRTAPTSPTWEGYPTSGPCSSNCYRSSH